MKTNNEILILILSVFALAPSLSHATAMSPEKSKCFSLEAIAQDHAKWEKEFSNYLNVDDSFTVQDRLRLGRSSMIKLVERLTNLKKTSALSGHDAILRDASNLLNAIERNEITPESSVQILRTGMINMSDAVNSTLRRAQYKFDSCNIIQDGKSSSSNATSAIGTR